VSEQMIFLLL